jgi:hypothetical protein
VRAVGAVQPAGVQPAVRHDAGLPPGPPPARLCRSAGRLLRPLPPPAAHVPEGRLLPCAEARVSAAGLAAGRTLGMLQLPLGAPVNLPELPRVQLVSSSSCACTL